MKPGPKPHTDEKTFIECWNKHDGDARLVAEELGMKYNSAWVRGIRLLKKYGITPSVNQKFDIKKVELNFEKLESEK